MDSRSPLYQSVVSSVNAFATRGASAEKPLRGSIHVLMILRKPQKDRMAKPAPMMFVMRRLAELTMGSLGCLDSQEIVAWRRRLLIPVNTELLDVVSGRSNREINFGVGY